MTESGQLGEPGAVELRRLDPRIRQVWWTVGAVLAVPLCLAVLLIELLVPIPLPAGLGTGVAIVVAGGAAASVPVVRYRRWAYTLRDDDLWIRSGLLWVTVSVIPLYRLQFVDTRQGPLDRLLGLAQLVVHTAAPGTSGRLPGLDSAEAETLREQLAEHQPDAAAPV